MIKSSNLLDSHAAEQEKKNHPFREVGVIFLEDASGRFLFVRTAKLPNSWQPLGGGKEEADESLTMTALRELREETSLVLRPEDVTFVLETPYDFGEGRVQFFRAKLPDHAILKFDEKEIIESRWMTLDEAKELPMFNATKACVEYIRNEQQNHQRT